MSHRGDSDWRTSTDIVRALSQPVKYQFGNPPCGASKLCKPVPLDMAAARVILGSPWNANCNSSSLAHLDYQGERYGWHLFVALNKDCWEAFVRQACRGVLEE